MQNEQAEQNLYETAGAEQTERSERSETRSSVNRFAYMSAEAPALRGELRGKALISEYSGKPIILHDMSDDFSTQPSGGSGKRIACGIFTEVL